MEPGQAGFGRFDEAPLRRVHWRWTAIAALGDYLDAGSIVAGAASLTFWVPYFHMNPSILGLVAAFSSNGISTAVGAAIAGPLGDRFGRKFIFMWDLILYAIGTLVVICSVDAGMLIAGYMLMGLAVGADVPTSWSLIAEFAPRRSRGRLMGLTNVFWYIGPIVILLLSLAFAHLGVTGYRLVFGSLLVVAVVTYLLRRFLVESPRWSYHSGREGQIEHAVDDLGGGGERVAATRERTRYRELFRARYLKRFAFILPIYVLWGIPAGTYGFFEPYLFRTLGAQSAFTADALDILWFASAIITVLFVFMPLNDRIDRRILYAVSAAMCAASFYLLVFLPVSNPVVAIVNILLFGLGQGIGLWPLQRVWSVELFPTMVRNTAQGALWAFMRLVIGIWSLFLPAITHGLGFQVVALVLAAMFTYNLIVGGLFGPRTGGRSLEDIQQEPASG